MTKRTLLQLIERMPHEAEVEMELPDPADDLLTINVKVQDAEFVDGVIRLS